MLNRVASLLLALTAVILYFSYDNTAENAVHRSIFAEKNAEPDGEKKGKSSFRKEYFRKIVAPDFNLTPEERLEKINKINALPSETVTDAIVNSWYFMGPYGNQNPVNNSKWSGRIVDFEPVTGSRTLRAASESGGLWRWLGIIPVPLSDNLNYMWIGSFCSHPTNDNVIFIGTGAPYVTGGIGLWRTNNFGTNWTQVTLSPVPSAFHKIRYQPGNPNNMHFASDFGYYRSTDGGTSWIRHLTGIVTDISFNPANPNIIYAGRSNSTYGNGDGNGGIYKSTNNGVNWVQLTAAPLPTGNILDIRLSHTAANQQVVAASIARLDNGGTLGVYKTTNDGAAWTSISPGFNFHGSQGSQHNDIRISPLNVNNIIVGGVQIRRTSNGGLNWTDWPSEANLHVDVHYIHWSTDNTVYICSDGGLSISSNGGSNWSTAANIYPVTQLYTVATPKNEKYIVSGGTQDNGTVIFLPTGTWRFGTGCDGGEVTIDPANTGIVYSFAFCPSVVRHKSSDYMYNYTLFNTGLQPEFDWFPNIGNDIVPPVELYTNAVNKVYRSVSPYSSWVEIGSFAFPVVNHHGLGVSRYTGSTILYAAVANTSPNSTNKMKVFDGGVWSERSAGLPSNVNVNKVSTHPTSNLKAFCCVQGPGRIFRTTNKGVLWTSITGNLPDLNLKGVLSHPTNDNILIAAALEGVFKSTNGGVSWFRWTNGMSQYINVTDITYIDSTAINSRFYAVISTYGRGFWWREISGDELVPVSNNNTGIPSVFSLGQNYPNPFNPSTSISFDLPEETNVKITIFDIQGKELEVLLNESKQAGYHRIIWSASNFPSGVYFYRLTAGGFTDTKKMILIK